MENIAQIASRTEPESEPLRETRLPDLDAAVPDYVPAGRERVYLAHDEGLQTFLSRFDADQIETFRQLAKEDRVHVEVLSAEQLRVLWDEQYLVFREPMILKHIVAEEISFPLNPEKCGESPITLVNRGDRSFLVIQGNHRLYKAVQETPDDTLVPVLVYGDVEGFEKMLGYDEMGARFPTHRASDTPRPTLKAGSRRQH